MFKNHTTYTLQIKKYRIQKLKNNIFITFLSIHIYFSHYYIKNEF